MIPDKIYIGNVTLSSNGLGERFLLSGWHIKPNPRVINEEYIRKETLLEWAKEKQYESLTIVADNFWQEVIDKLNSM